MTAEPHPALSVVVPSVNGWDDLRGCLEALERERAEVDLEVLVPDRVGDSVRTRVAETFPWVTVIPAPERSTIPALRAMAFERASRITAVKMTRAGDRARTARPS